jgi:hypothetical protein
MGSGHSKGAAAAAAPKTAAKDAGAAPNNDNAQLVVVGLGDPVTDVLVPVSHELRASLAEHAGGCVAVDADAMARLLRQCADEVGEPAR